MGLPLFESTAMKNLTIVQQFDKGARFVTMPDTFNVHVSENNEIIFVAFNEIGTNRLLHCVFVFIDPEYPNDQSYYDFSEAGQEMILQKMSEHIIDDIGEFLSDIDDEECKHTPVCNHRYFDNDEFERRWVSYYKKLLKTPAIQAEYLLKPKKHKKNKNK